MKKPVTISAMTAIAALALSACGAAPDQQSSAPSGEESGAGANAATGDAIKACVVSDEGGFEDRSFNQSAREGLSRAEADLGVSVADAESASPADFGPNVSNLVQEGCDIVIGIGYMLQEAMIEAAQANPDVKFALVDSSFVGDSTPDGVENGRALVFNTAEASYLAGYAAAGMSQTGTVGAYVGMNLPSTAIFNDGFADGIAAYNEAKGTDVKLLGWDKDKQDGMVIGDFSDSPKGQQFTEQLFQQGADIVMPVAGQAGLGTLSAAKEAENKMVIWVDADGAEAQPEYAPVILTSVMKEIDNAVFDTIKSVQDGSFDSTDYIGTLANGGVGLAPWHDFEDKVPEELKSEIADLQEKIISGEITVETVNQP